VFLQQHCRSVGWLQEERGALDGNTGGEPVSLSFPPEPARSSVVRIVLRLTTLVKLVVRVGLHRLGSGCQLGLMS
jgi:hypothetical protein